MNERKIIEDWESRFDVRFSWGKDDYEWTTKTNVTPRMVKIEVEGLLQKQAELSYQEGIEAAKKVISIHDVGDGEYCDTGDDMEWACRSECIEKAIERLESLKKQS